MGQRLQALEERLQKLVAADEAMLRSFRNHLPVELIHPARFPAPLVLKLWPGYLRREFRRHGFWLVVNLVLLLPSLLLTPLPGPNVVGMWFAFRVVGHGLALAGIWRARRATDQLTLTASEALDEPIDNPEPTHSDPLERLIVTCGTPGLATYLDRRGRQSSGNWNHEGTLLTAEHP